MEKVFLGLWDNYGIDSEKRAEELNEVYQVVKNNEKTSVSFRYDGRTRHQSASQNMARMLKEIDADLDFDIGYNYHFVITNPNI